MGYKLDLSLSHPSHYFSFITHVLLYSVLRTINYMWLYNSKSVSRSSRKAKSETKAEIHSQGLCTKCTVHVFWNLIREI